ncbi:EAL domain-containing protein [Pseudoalteromonas sp. MMG012]|uniref:EAL domain-containing protein n=1 Tax=Pseudoalteromonas sp. MMG012 TaxID=2822686 RepID=UPI001B3A00F8|nr:EAL domain-containing protein [Pseudoalteromonas sp. MMG012]MBQ4851943.1 EAL domain-containing protein [Pseudoalteromonas sp. MMG012]
MNNLFLLLAVGVAVVSIVALVRMSTLRKKDQKALREIKKAKSALSKKIFYHGDSDIPNYRQFMQKLLKVERKFTRYHISLIKLGKQPVFDDIDEQLASFSELFNTISKSCEPFALALYDSEYMLMAFVTQGTGSNTQEAIEKQKDILHKLPEQVLISGTKVPIDYAISSLSLTGYSAIYGMDKVQRRLTYSMDHALESEDGTFFHNEQLYKAEMYKKHVLRKLTSSISFNPDDFYLVFQPMYIPSDLDKPKRYEALIRWKNHKNLGPKTFIPMLKSQPGLQEGMTEIVLNQVFSLFKVQLDSKKDLTPIHVNITKQELNTEHLFGHLKQLLKGAPAIASFIIFEVEQNDTLTESELIKSNMRKIINLGCRFSIDNFGNDRKSYQLLSNGYYKTIKVDKSYIGEVRDRHATSKSLEQIMSTAKRSKLTVIVEGVENRYQLDYIKSFENAMLQGYYISAPLSAHNYLSMENKQSVTLS